MPLSFQTKFLALFEPILAWGMTPATCYEIWENLPNYSSATVSTLFTQNDKAIKGVGYFRKSERPEKPFTRLKSQDKEMLLKIFRPPCTHTSWDNSESDSR